MRFPVISRRALPMALLVLIGACCSPTASEREVQFRLRNDSPYTLEDVAVGFPEMVAVGDLEPGQASAYQRVRRAYGYAYVEAKVNGQRIVQQPIDFMGEEYLEPGAYTYVVTIADPADEYGLRTSLVRD